jgi:GTP-binding protein
VDDYQRQMLERSIETRLSFLKFAPLHFISAQKRQGLEPLWKSIIQAHRAATCKMPTPVLTRILMSRSVPDAQEGGSLSSQDALCPPGRHEPAHHRDPRQLAGTGHRCYKRFLEGRFRKEFNLVGTPLRIDLKTSHNPYADKD